LTIALIIYFGVMIVSIIFGVAFLVIEPVTHDDKILGSRVILLSPIWPLAVVAVLPWGIRKLWAMSELDLQKVTQWKRN
jgi:hypothetical protein